MSKTLVVAEKPDQAKSFYVPLLERKFGEKFERKDGYLESANYYVSWFYGHIIRAMNPDEYDERYKAFRDPSLLPILPDALTYQFGNPGGEKQGKVIATLANTCDTVVCATDPDREGQGIFGFFFNWYKINRPIMKRLWSPSLTDKDLDKAWDKMKDYKDYDNLLAACTLRQWSDWLVGMNGSRAYSIATGGGVSVGRVQTTVLKMIVDRDREIENYKESFYYKLWGKWAGFDFLYYQDKESKFENEAFLGNLISTIVDKDKFKIESFKEEKRTENPKKPFNLPDLQKEASRVLGFALDKTLEIAQKLYEKKLITYPRTESPYLPESDLAEYHALIRRVATEEQKKYLVEENVKPACVKDTDAPHTALVITGENPAGLTDDEAKLYDLILERFVVSFMRPNTFWFYLMAITNVGNDMTSGMHIFKSNVKVHDDRGFLDYLAGRGAAVEEDNEDEEAVSIGSDRLDENLISTIVDEEIRDLNIEKVKRQKPKHYTPGTLVTAMQTCGKSITDPKFRKILSEVKGIGTAATQASFPVKLLEKGFITEAKGKVTVYKSTSNGRALVDAVMEKLKSPELTAEWEMKLRLVEAGDYEESAYRQEMQKFIYEIVDEAMSVVGKHNISTKLEGVKCPKCGKGDINIYKTFYACSQGKDACGFTFSKEICGVGITEKIAAELVKNGTTSSELSFANKGKKWKSRLKIDGEHKIV